MISKERHKGNKEIEECVCCEGRCNAHCPHEKNTGELYFLSKGKYSKGNTEEHNIKMGKILDGLPMSLAQTEHEQIWHQWPNYVPKIITCSMTENQHRIPNKIW